MDNQVNENIIEKVKIKDIFESFKEIISGKKTDNNKEIINQKLQAIYNAEKELGSTDSISILEKNIENHEIENDKKKKRTKATKKITENTNNVISTEMKKIEVIEKEENEKSLD